MGWSDPRMLRAVSRICRALCRKPPDASGIWGLLQTENGLVAARGNLASPEAPGAICPEYVHIAERLQKLIVQGANAETGLQEMATMVASLSDSDQGKAALAEAVTQAQGDLGSTGDTH